MSSLTRSDSPPPTMPSNNIAEQGEQDETRDDGNWWRSFVISTSIVYVLPFTDIISTQLPSVFFLIELVDTFNVNLSLAGAFMAIIYVFRVLALSACIRWPRASSFAGSTVALVGMTAIAVFQDNKISLIVGNLSIGLAGGVLGALQIFVKDYFAADKDVVGHKLKVQLSVTSFGYIFVFFVGGMLYEYLDVTGVASFGALVLTIQVITLLVVFVLQRIEGPTKKAAGTAGPAEKDTIVTKRSSSTIVEPSKLDSIKENEVKEIPSPSEDLEASSMFLESGVSADDITSVEEGNKEDEQYTSIRRPTMVVNNYAFLEDLPIAWINYLVVAGVGFQSIVNGFLFGTGSLLMYEEFNLSKSIIGILYALSAASGAVTSVLILNKKVVGFLKRWLPTPHVIYLCLTGAAVLTSMSAIPIFVIYVISFLLVNVFLIPFTSLLTELQGKISTKSNYQKLGPFGQILRRMFGVGAAFGAPALYGVMPRLPNIVGGAISFLFLGIVVVGFEKCKASSIQQMKSVLGDENVHAQNSSVSVLRGSNGRERRRLSFSEQVIIANMIADKREAQFREEFGMPSVELTTEEHGA